MSAFKPRSAEERAEAEADAMRQMEAALGPPRPLHFWGVLETEAAFTFIPFRSKAMRDQWVKTGEECPDWHRHALYARDPLMKSFLRICQEEGTDPVRDGPVRINFTALDN